MVGLDNVWGFCGVVAVGVVGLFLRGNLFAFGEKSQNRQNRTLDLRESHRVGAAINWAQDVLMKSERVP